LIFTPYCPLPELLYQKGRELGIFEEEEEEEEDDDEQE